jgi:hypothetical protein
MNPTEYEHAVKSKKEYNIFLLDQLKLFVLLLEKSDRRHMVQADSLNSIEDFFKAHSVCDEKIQQVK